jgi:hypothetical protein
MGKNRLVVLAMVALPATACIPDPGVTGELGNARFVLDQGFFGDGSDFDEPIAAGSLATIDVHILDPRENDPDGDLTFTTTDPDRLRVDSITLREARSDADHRDYFLYVTALAPGAVDLRAERADGELVDRTAVEIARPASLELDAGPDLARDELTLHVGHTIEYTTTVRDADGRSLHAFLDVVWASEPAGLVGLSHCAEDPETTLCDPADHVADEDGYARGMSVGHGRLRGTLGDAELVVEVDVRP